jgi:hypothetical protein
MDTIELLTSLIQNHVDKQPHGYYRGETPMPVEVTFDRGTWTVRFVLGLTKTGSKRRWGYASGTTLRDALMLARSMQSADARAAKEET